MGVVVVVLIFYNVFYASYKQNENRKKFYTNEIFSVVLSSKSFEERSVEFHLSNGLKVYFLPPIDGKIMIEDSIRKDKNTYQYEVYRKDSYGLYGYFATYDFEHIQ